MDDSNPLADAVLIDDGKIKEVGRWADLAHCDADERLDAGGRAVVPGLIDSHAHLLSYGLSLGEVDLTGAQSVEDVLDLLSNAPTQDRVLRACQLDPDSLKENRYPTLDELDSISPERPVFVKRRDEHSSVVNSAAFRLLALPDDTDGIEVDHSTNTASGLLKRKANQIALETIHGMIDEDQMKEAYMRAGDSAAHAGATTIHALVGADERPERGDCETLLAMREELPVRTVVYYQTRHVDRAVRLGLSRVGGCILMDGSIGSRTAAFSTDYADDPGNRGYLYLSDEELLPFFESAEELGLQIAVHAIGDRAVEQALRCFSKLIEKRSIRDHRHRIEHAELVSSGQIERISELGICLGMQPAFEGFWGDPGGMYEKRLGVERASKLNRLAAMVRRGICVSGGSDAPITPLDPVYGIHCAVNHPFEDSRLTVKQALEVFTIQGARIAHEEDRVGSITPGLHADLVGLSSDPFSVRPESIREIEVSFVICRGRLVVNRTETSCAGQGVGDA
jgi:predicted amidohydrolase YtcJ